jgi:hypothetical protein
VSCGSVVRADIRIRTWASGAYDDCPAMTAKEFIPLVCEHRIRVRERCGDLRVKGTGHLTRPSSLRWVEAWRLDGITSRHEGIDSFLQVRPRVMTTSSRRTAALGTDGDPQQNCQTELQSA